MFTSVPLRAVYFPLGVAEFASLCVFFCVCLLAPLAAVDNTPQAHPDGCRILGMLFVKRVPGAMTISVHSEHHSFDHSIINMAHNVNMLVFGDPLDENAKVRLPPPSVPPPPPHMSPCTLEFPLSNPRNTASPC